MSAIVKGCIGELIKVRSRLLKHRGLKRIIKLIGRTSSTMHRLIGWLTCRVNKIQKLTGKICGADYRIPSLRRNKSFIVGC